MTSNTPSYYPFSSRENYYMKRVPYESVAIEIEKLYDFSITDEKQIEERCLFIQNFIESCGWTIEDYTRVMMGFDNPQSN